MKKRILSLALVITLTLALAPAVSAAGTQTGMLRYNFKNADTTYSAYFEVTNVAGIWKSSLAYDSYPVMHVFVSAPSTVKLVNASSAVTAEKPGEKSVFIITNSSSDVKASFAIMRNDKRIAHSDGGRSSTGTSKGSSNGLSYLFAHDTCELTINYKGQTYIVRAGETLTIDE